MESADRTSSGDMSSRVRDFHNALRASCIPRIDKATTPIIGVQDNRIVHDRSAVLYQIGGHSFALTAAHDLREIVEQNIGLYISVNHPHVLPLPLAEAKFMSTEVDERDLGVIWIPPDIATEVAKFKDFLFHNQINHSQERTNALLLFYGYPMQWAGHLITERRMVSGALAFSTFEDHLDPSSVRGYDPQLHMLLNFTSDAIEATTGQQKRLPGLKGISGCGIWQVGEKRGGEAIPRTGETLTLVGIEQGVYSNHDRVKATRIEYALDLILHNYPELRDAMSLAYRQR